jgi:hypothetical protein
MGACSGPGWKLGFIAFFFLIDRGQRCLSGANRCFLERRSVSLANYHLRDLLQSALHSEKVFEAFSM